MSWYCIVLIGIVAFAFGFTAALFWLRGIIRRRKKKEQPTRK